MSDLNNSLLHIQRYKIRKENIGYIVRFENQDEYYVVNETGKLVLDFLQKNTTTFTELNAYLESEFSGFTQESKEEVMRFISSLMGLSIITNQTTGGAPK